MKNNQTCAATCIALGCFDGVHLGHKEVINTALSLNQYEPAVFTFKSRMTDNITTDRTKHRLLTNLGVRHIFSYDFQKIRDLSPGQFVSEILLKNHNAEAVCCGWDFRFGRGAQGGADDLAKICKKHGVMTIIIPPLEIDGIPVSSTLIRRLIAEGGVEQVNSLLGHKFSYELRVVGGNMLGRTIGFPTINQNMPKNCVVPRFGVYKSRVIIKNEIYDGITNIGVKPTAGENGNIMIETHIIGYDGDLYGRIIRVCLMKFIRPEKKFNDFTELAAQIEKDIEVSLNG
ncbi:MAG: bifunctional riboflavin kinase/FAD synthetase [Oscillospiraceae bacterium]|nr:bifunctional riboflavin kinase/FAD synthetase [Oscillospiraceae bacterium]